MTKESQYDTDKPKLLYKISFLRAHFKIPSIFPLGESQCLC